jgi:HD superfamily phosphohydrolase YqeK
MADLSFMATSSSDGMRTCILHGGRPILQVLLRTAACTKKGSLKAVPNTTTMQNDIIDGNLLRQLGYTPGPAFKEILRWSEKLDLLQPNLTAEDKIERLRREFPPQRAEELNRRGPAVERRRDAQPEEEVAFTSVEDLILSVRDSSLRKQLLDIYTATREAAFFLPASIRFHHTEKGGYYRHVTEVMNIAIKLLEMLRPPGITRDEVLALSFIHDLSKLESYEVDQEGTHKAQRDSLQATGRLDRNEELTGAVRARLSAEERTRLQEIVVFRRREGIPTSHFGKTIAMAQNFGLKINDRWLHAIEQHHGPYSDFKTPQVHTLATLLFTADYLSSKLYGHRSSCNYAVKDGP